MRNPEFIKLRNRFYMALGIALLFTIPMLLFIINRFNEKPSKLLTSLTNKESILILVTKDKCKTCKEKKEFLKENQVSFYELNVDKDNNIYEVLLRKISLSKDEIIPPTIIYLEKGILNSTLVNSSDEELLDYLEYNKLLGTK